MPVDDEARVADRIDGTVNVANALVRLVLRNVGEYGFVCLVPANKQHLLHGHERVLCMIKVCLNGLSPMQWRRT